MTNNELVYGSLCFSHAPNGCIQWLRLVLQAMKVVTVANRAISH
jgi:hypothetical protein